MDHSRASRFLTGEFIVSTADGANERLSKQRVKTRDSRSALSIEYFLLQ